MNEPKSLRQCALDPKTVKALALEGIETGTDLMSWPMADIADIKGIGKKALGAIYDTRFQLASEREAAAKPAQADAPKAPPPPPMPPVVTHREFMVDLQVRHADWIDEQVAATNNTASKVIEYCVRQIYGKDHNKAGRVNSGPDGGGTILAKHNPNKAGKL